jgi:hypothetical protein
MSPNDSSPPTGVRPLQRSPLEAHANPLEFEWQRWYEAVIIARAEYHALAADRAANAELLDAARERLDRAEAAKSKVMAKLERFSGC